MGVLCLRPTLEAPRGLPVARKSDNDPPPDPNVITLRWHRFAPFMTMPDPSHENSGQINAIRRSVTLPTKLNSKPIRGSTAPNPNLAENVIFYHPSAKIVHFAPRALSPIPSSSGPSDFDYPVDTIETLPWRSATERTVATAPLRLERVHGLTVFLKCGNVVHAILKNSQCWCVDGVSKFVLRIRPLTYYRIEIPNETESDKELVGDLKTALPTVLRYEVTPCPFKRAFTVELPEEATAPRRKKAWRPKGRKEGATDSADSGLDSPAEAKPEWLDSVSTGDETDGATTDDSALTTERSEGAPSDSHSVRDRSPSVDLSVDLPEPRSQPMSMRRSVSETPHTFTSIRAKFEVPGIIEEQSSVAPVSECDTTQKETADEPTKIPGIVVSHDETAIAQTHEPVDPTQETEQAAVATEEQEASEQTEPMGNLTEDEDANGPAGPTVLDQSTVIEGCHESTETTTKLDPNEDSHDEASLTEIIPDSNATSSELLEEDQPSVDIQAQKDPFAHFEAQDAPVTVEPVIEKAQVEANDHTEDLQKAQLGYDTTISEAPIVGNESHETITSISSEDAMVEATPANLNTGTASITASEPKEADAQYTPPKLVKPNDAQVPSPSSTPESFHSADPSSPADSISTRATTMNSPGNVPQKKNRAAELSAPQSRGSSLPSNSVIQGPPLNYRDSSDASPKNDTDPFSRHQMAREDLPKPLLGVSSAHAQSPAKASSSTDRGQMSVEFRRRAQATRQRDVSPMPPPSAIYQPKPGEKTSSFISTALTLVLLPPVQLFIVLLHIAARIVLNPATKPTFDPSNQTKSESSTEPPVAEDDFSFPLQRESSSEYEDAEMTKKLDPWDLD